MVRPADTENDSGHFLPPSDRLPDCGGRNLHFHARNRSPLPPRDLSREAVNPSGRSPRHRYGAGGLQRGGPRRPL